MVRDILHITGTIWLDEHKTSIHLVNKSAFAGVATRKSALLLNVKSAAPLASPRSPKFEKVSASRYHQEIKLTDPSEVDVELLGWLKQAYDLSV